MTTTKTIESLIASLVSTADESLVPVLQDAIEGGVTGAGKTVYVVITEKSRKWQGNEIPEKRSPHDFAVIVPGKSIRLFGLTRCTSRDCERCRIATDTHSAAHRVWLAAYVEAGRKMTTPPPVRPEHLVSYDRTYNVGDIGLRDSFNLDYTDRIVAISAKSVAFENTNTNRKADGSWPRQMHDLAKFSRRHRSFDLNDSARRNAEWMD